MNRRNFLKSSAPLAVVPFYSGRLFAAALPSSLLDAAVLAAPPQDDRVLVIVQMSGGNDGLNTVLPLDQYSRLSAARSNILIPDTAALRLGTTQTALHPSMTGMRDLYQQNKLSVIQSVSYANPDFSHFRATDIWMSGSDSKTVVSTGWLGRYLQFAYPGFPEAYPNMAMPDPLSIAIGSDLDLGLQGYSISTGQTVPENFAGTLTSLLPFQNSAVPNTNAGIEIAFLRGQQQYSNIYATNIVNAWNAGANSVTYPAPPAGVGNLAQQLKIVARLIKGGLKTRVYWVQIGGFDTHAAQVNTANKTQGTHANLLKGLSDAIATFQNDLQALGLADRVLGMTFSEFGRRIRSNASIGTDHGSSYPMFLFGSKVKQGIIGTNPVIPATVGVNDNVAMQFDFHSVYLSVLTEWFCLTPADANNVLGFAGAPLSTINTNCALILPVAMTHFSAEKANVSDAHLSWGTASEDNAARFEVQRSTDGASFDTIGSVAATGHTHTPQRYEFLDDKVPLYKGREFYYRLKVRDRDGDFVYSDIRSVAFEQGSGAFEAEISPNPSEGGAVSLTVRGPVSEDTPTELTVCDLYGREVAQQTQYLTANTPAYLELGKSGALAAGVYVVTVRNGANRAVQRVVVR